MTGQTIRHLVRCCTAKRLLNLGKIFISYILSDKLKRSIVWGLPYTLTIEPTNLCNLRCPECPSGTGELTRPLGMMAMENFKRIIDEVSEHAFYVQLFFQGEPFLHKHLFEMIRYAHQRKMYVAISTNAHFISRDNAREFIAVGLDRLIVSLDGVTQATYQDYRVGGSLAKVTDALSILAEERRAQHSTLEVLLQFLVTKQNESEIPMLHIWAKQYRATVVLKTMQVYSLAGANQFLPTNERFSRYEIVNGELRTKNKMHNRCVRLWERSVVTWDGAVVPCCFDKDAKHVLGRLNGTGFRAIWRSATYDDFRNRILTNRRGVEMCANCTEGLKIYR